MKTSFFTLGQNHAHRVNGHTLDKDVVIKITDENPREKMFEIFGAKWSFEHQNKPDMKYFPRGIYNLTENTFENGKDHHQF